MFTDTCIISTCLNLFELLHVFMAMNLDSDSDKRVLPWFPGLPIFPHRYQPSSCTNWILPIASGFTTLINFLRGPQDTRNYYSDTCNPYMYIQPIHVHTTHTGCVFIHRWTPVYSKWTIMIPQWKLIYPNDTICINNILNEFYLSNS